MELCLKRYEPATMLPDNATVLFIGKRGSGKSTCMKSILYDKRYVKSGICMSATESANSFWSECIPSTFIFDEYRGEYVQNLIKRQKRQKKKTGEIDPAFIIFEDVIYDTKMCRENTVREVFMNGRHFGLLTLFSIQYALLVPPYIRSNTDVIFIFRESLLANQERLYAQFGGLFSTFKMFQEVLKACTEQYECLVINQTGAVTNKVEDCVFWYKAGIPPPFKAGSVPFWQYHIMNHRDDDSEESDDDMGQARTFRVRKVM